MIRFIVRQYRFSRRVGFTPARALRRAFAAYHSGF